MRPEDAEQVADDELLELTRDYRKPLLAIFREQEHQCQKWGRDKPQSLPGFLMVLESELPKRSMAR